MSSVTSTIPTGPEEPALHPFYCIDRDRPDSELAAAFYLPYLRQVRMNAYDRSNTQLALPPPVHHSSVSLNDFLECLRETDPSRGSVTIRPPGLHTPIPNHSASVPLPSTVVYGDFHGPNLFFVTAGQVVKNEVFRLQRDGPEVGFLRQCGLGRDFVMYHVARVDNSQVVRVVFPLVLARSSLSWISRLRLHFPCCLCTVQDLRARHMPIQIDIRDVSTSSFGGGEDIEMTSVSSYRVASISPSMIALADELVGIYEL